MRCQPQTERIQDCELTHGQDQKDTVFEAYVNFSKNMAQDEDSQTILHMPYSDGEFNVRTIISNGTAVADAPAFDAYFSIPYTSTTVRSTNISDLTNETNGNLPARA